MIHFDDNTKMPFGRYKGIALANIPAEYLIYIFENMTISEPLKAYIKNNMDVLKADVARQKKFNAQ